MVRLRELLAQCRFGRRIDAYDSVGSTNDVARLLGRQGAADGTLVIAEYQSAGRGRRARVWESVAAAGLYMSLLLRPRAMHESYPAALQLLAGVALAETLSPLLPQPAELLWPNDCVCLGQKLAGVLVESEATGPELDFLVCGIGVNVNQARADFSPRLGALATSVGALAGRRIDRAALLVDLLFALEAWDEVARGSGIEPIIGRWLELAPSATGSGVEVETDAGLVVGESAGLSERGYLVVNTERGLVEIVTGELVRVRRRQ